ncbi:MAG: glycosyltransferase family 39 protein, partial [Chloroflexota bacterium]|nr:glycosyltransferase family 39 protein [Chloroflexota bacterium]
MSVSRLFVKAVLPVISIFLILASILQLRAQLWAAGALCLILAMVSLMLGIRLFEKNPFTAEESELLRPFIRPALLWTLVSSLLALSVLYVVDNSANADTDRIAAAAWLASVLLGLLLIWGTRPRAQSTLPFMERVSVHRIEIILLLIVLLLALTLRTLDLSAHPYPWSGDEASIGIEARRILSGNITNFFATGWSSQPNWSFVPTAITEWVVGKNIVAVRLPSALAGTLAVLFVYLFGRELFSSAIGLMAAAFLASLPYNLHFSRVGVHNVVDSLMSALVFWLIARAINKNDWRYYYTAGAAAGLCIYSYAGTRLVLILAGLILLFLILRQKGYLASQWKHFGAFSIAGLITAAPQAAFFARHPDIFIGRLGQEGILFNGWLTQQAALTGKSVWEILFNQFSKTIMVFIASPAVGNFFNSPYPFLTVLGSMLFLLGMGYALAYL